MTEIQKKLFALADAVYRDFNAKLIPNIDKSAVIGVRSPNIKALARELERSGGAEAFLKELPHVYLEEYVLHTALVSRVRDFDRALAETERLLPFIDNWAVSDSLSPLGFKKSPERLLPHIDRWLASGKTYSIRFAELCLMRYFLDDLFREDYLEKSAAVKSDEYYVNMMTAWYFATALAKQYPAAVRFLEEKRLSPWIHNKTIQKAVESFRISDDRKAYLRTLRLKKRGQA